MKVEEERQFQNGGFGYEEKTYLEVDYDENFEEAQEKEYDWVSTVLGSQDTTNF